MQRLPHLFRSLNHTTRLLNAARHTPPTPHAASSSWVASLRERHLCTSNSSPSTQATPKAIQNEKANTILGLHLDQNHIPEQVLRALSLEMASRSERRRARKGDIISRFSRSESDTGSPEVQVALLTDRIVDLTQHVIKNKKDVMTRRSLIMLVNQRRKMMRYLLRKDTKRYMELVEALGLRPSSVFSKDLPLGAKKAPTPKLH